MLVKVNYLPQLDSSLNNFFLSFLITFGFLLRYRTKSSCFVFDFVHEIHRYVTQNKKAPLSSFIFLIKAVAMATSHPLTGTNFVIFDHFLLIFLISLREMSFNFATLY